MKWRTSKILLIEVPLKVVEILGFFGTYGDLQTAHEVILGLTNFQILLIALFVSPLISFALVRYGFSGETPPSWVMKIPLLNHLLNERAQPFTSGNREKDTYPLKDDLIKLSNTISSHAHNLDGTWETRIGANYDMERQTLLRGCERHQISHPDAGADRSEWYDFCVRLYPYAKRGEINGCRQVYNEMTNRLRR